MKLGSVPKEPEIGRTSPSEEKRSHEKYPSRASAAINGTLLPVGGFVFHRQESFSFLFVDKSEKFNNK
jgi:hypothetical protein